MSPPEIGPSTHAFLAERPTLTLGTLRADGSPQASVVWYLWDGASFSISTVASTAKWKNLRRDPRCSVCVEDPATGQMVVGYGSAELQTDDVWDRTRALVARYYDDEPSVDAHIDRISRGEPRVLVHVRPQRIITRRLDDPVSG